MTEREAMKRAFALALQGWGRVAPNPLVGAVFLRDGRVIAEGAHLEYGSLHAEAAALAACGDPTGATCVVNLEPCGHAGKTPSCAEALIAAGVSRVVFAVRDPHPEAGGGTARLRDAGIEVVGGLCEEEGAALNAAFLWGQVRRERPFIALKLATTLDGFLADTEGRSQWISGPEAQQYVHWLRAGFDAIGVGRITAETDDPGLTVRGSVEPRIAPTRVIFTREGRLAAELSVVATARETPTIIVTADGAVARVEETVAGTGALVIGGGGVEQSFQALRDSGVRSILIEGGGTLAGALLDANLVDRLYWIQAPRWLGDGIAAFGGRNGQPLNAADPWVVVERRPLGQDTLLVADRELCLPES